VEPKIPPLEKVEPNRRIFGLEKREKVKPKIYFSKK
jgi:hypothetical protein